MASSSAAGGIPADDSRLPARGAAIPGGAERQPRRSHVRTGPEARPVRPQPEGSEARRPGEGGRGEAGEPAQDRGASPADLAPPRLSPPRRHAERRALARPAGADRENAGRKGRTRRRGVPAALRYPRRLAVMERGAVASLPPRRSATSLDDVEKGDGRVVRTDPSGSCPAAQFMLKDAQFGLAEGADRGREAVPVAAVGAPEGCDEPGVRGRVAPVQLTGRHLRPLRGLTTRSDILAVCNRLCLACGGPVGRSQE
jgi:hypothetical protein